MPPNERGGGSPDVEVEDHPQDRAMQWV
jgi:hypothetical protein